MSALVEALYPLPDYRRTPLTLLRWWESRRWLYNRVVGAAGLVTLSSLSLAAALTPLPGPQAREVVAFTLVYAVLANLCYSFGWAVEVAARFIWGGRAPDLGPLLFRQGVIFSVGLTLLPILLIGFATVVEIVLLVAG